MNKADQITLYEAYKQYKIVCKRKKTSKKQRAAVHKEIVSRIDMLLLLLNSPSAGQKEKSKAVNAGKKLYQQYCVYWDEKASDTNPCMEEKIDRLLFQMTIVEAEQVATFRKQEVGGNRIKLANIFQDERVVALTVMWGYLIRDIRFAICPMEILLLMEPAKGAARKFAGWLRRNGLVNNPYY